MYVGYLPNIWLECECKFRSLYVYCQVTPWKTKNDEYINAHHAVVLKNGGFINYNIFLY